MSIVAAPPAPDTSIDPTTKKVLVVEDELICAYDLSDSLERLGYEVAGIVDTGEEAIARAQQQEPPDIILMDIQLRGAMSGIDAASEIAAFDIPVIYLTAFGDKATVERAAALTAPYGYLTKPYRVEDIAGAIAIALAKRQRDASDRETIAAQKQLNDYRSRFLAMAAHDLRKPLASISMSIELLQHYDGQISQEKKLQYFNHMRRALREMKMQLDDLLVEECVEIGKLPLRPVPLDTVVFCTELIEDYETTINGKYQLGFNYVGSNHRQLFLDRSLLRYILNNLLSNAIKYSPEHSRIELVCIGSEDRATFQVRDRGIGMPADFLEKLFLPFERAGQRGERSRLGNGTVHRQASGRSPSGNHRSGQPRRARHHIYRDPPFDRTFAGPGLKRIEPLQ